MFSIPRKVPQDNPGRSQTFSAKWLSFRKQYHVDHISAAEGVRVSSLPEAEGYLCPGSGFPKILRAGCRAVGAVGRVWHFGRSGKFDFGTLDDLPTWKVRFGERILEAILRHSKILVFFQKKQIILNQSFEFSKNSLDTLQFWLAGFANFNGRLSADIFVGRITISQPLPVRKSTEIGPMRT